MYVLCSIKKAARRTTPGSGMANGGAGGGGGLFAGLKTSATPSLGFGVSSGAGGLPGLGTGSLGRAPLSSISAGQSNAMMSFNKKPATMDCKEQLDNRNSLLKACSRIVRWELTIHYKNQIVIFW